MKQFVLIASQLIQPLLRLVNQSCFCSLPTYLTEYVAICGVANSTTSSVDNNSDNKKGGVGAKKSRKRSAAGEGWDYCRWELFWCWNTAYLFDFKLPWCVLFNSVEHSLSPGWNAFLNILHCAGRNVSEADSNVIIVPATESNTPLSPPPATTQAAHITHTTNHIKTREELEMESISSAAALLLQNELLSLSRNSSEIRKRFGWLVVSFFCGEKRCVVFCNVLYSVVESA